MDNIITVIIPVKDRANIVGETLDSLARQTAKKFDTILVDNGSKDDTLSMLNTWSKAYSSPSRPVKVISQPVAGAAAARNAGMLEASTPWVLFFDSDDLMLPGHIARVIDGIAANPGADLLGWDTDYNGSRKKFHCDNLHWYNLFEGGFATQRWAAKKELVERAGGWNNMMTLWDDIELGSRIINLHPSIVKLKGAPTVKVRPQQVSISTNLNGDYLDRMETPLAAIAPALPAGREYWTLCVKMINLGNTYRSAIDCATISAVRKRYRETLAQAPSLRIRALLMLLYHFRRLGGRGQNRLLRLSMGRTTPRE